MKKVLIVVSLLLAAPLFVSDAKNQDPDYICYNGECWSDGKEQTHIWVCGDSGPCRAYAIK